MRRLEAWAAPVLQEFADGRWHRGSTEAREIMVEERGEFWGWAARALKIGVALALGWLEREHGGPGKHDWLRLTPSGRTALSGGSDER